MCTFTSESSSIGITLPSLSTVTGRWACGVVMYTLLVGCPPFWHRKQMVMLRNIMEGKYSFASPEWDDITGVYKQALTY
ncbi:hypothetical protein J437_LFUL017672 [Ladona fulva]|uniref:Protein kinase domain-containing protein n=1 Tax=Ladona fulva TaxID=123851 RepID=A0A8K0KPZ1_LADFU|nr:hypothetical protein J437_LFUL017672 [Ladona fulva]